MLNYNYILFTFHVEIISTQNNNLKLNTLFNLQFNVHLNLKNDLIK